MDKKKFFKPLSRSFFLKFGPLFLFFILVLAVALTPVSLRQFANAITGNYSKNTGDDLTSTDWNNLDDDFLAKSGGTMSGDLNMGGKKITNLADPTVDTDTANKQYVDSKAGGGSTFTNWGSSNCPSGTQKLYSGFALSSYWGNSGGGSNPICIEPGDAGPASTQPTDWIYPLGTGGPGTVPPGITPLAEIKCAVCYQTGGTCFERWGAQNCNGMTGFTPVYVGYALGSHRDYNNTNRYCVNSTGFDGSVNNTIWGAIWYGTAIGESNDDVNLYTNYSYIKCALCCN